MRKSVLLTGLLAAAVVGLATTGFAQDLVLRGDVPQVTVQSSNDGVWGACLKLLVSVIQLVVGLGIAAFAINTGLNLLSKLLSKDGPAFDIWAQIKNKNVAVAVLGAGVVVSYATVIASGITGMQTSLGGLMGGGATWREGVSGLVGSLVNLGVAIAVASFAITVVFRVMDKLTKDMDERKELTENNVAVGALYCGLLIAVSQLVAAGVSGIGAGVNAVINALLGR